MPLPQVVRDHDRAVASRSEEHRRDRFSHLLQPIRDLAENFSIDLATELEDYLEELEDLEIAFHDHSEDGAGPHSITRVCIVCSAAFCVLFVLLFVVVVVLLLLRLSFLCPPLLLLLK